MTTPPCKGCPDRAPGCHGRCEKYRAYKTAYARERENRDRFWDAEAARKLAVRRMEKSKPPKRD